MREDGAGNRRCGLLGVERAHGGHVGLRSRQAVSHAAAGEHELARRAGRLCGDVFARVLVREHGERRGRESGEEPPSPFLHHSCHCMPSFRLCRNLGCGAVLRSGPKVLFNPIKALSAQKIPSAR